MVSRHIAIVALVCAAHTSVRAAMPDDRSTVQEVPSEGVALGELVESYFRAEDPEERLRLAGKIESAGHGDLGAVAQALGRARLWSAPPNREGRFSFDSAITGAVPVTYRLPGDYDPALRYPMIVCMPHDGASASDTLRLAVETLGDSISGFTLICPDRSVGHTFHQPVEAAGDVQRLMREARRQIHTDTDRVFVFGIGRGGEATWMAAITQPDLFAGAVVLSGYPRVPYPEQVYAFLLENLRRVPVLAVWGSSAAPGATTREKTVAAHNRAIVEFAEKVSLPIVGVEISSDGLTGLKPPVDEVRRLLARRRSPPSSAVHHWFRYPAHGRAGWLRQAKFMGDVWEADQLSILASPAVDHDKFITDVIKGKLAYLGGRLDGQTVTIETRKCARLDLLLPMGLVDLNKPVLVRCNGRKRYDRVLEPSVQDMLETAYESWEFQRPIAARLSFSIRTSAELD